MLEPRHILDVKKQQIENNLLGLFDRVRQSIDDAVGCLGAADKALCQAVVDGDPAINEARRMLEQDCLVAIASQQPVAHDLREIVACMRVATELERIADHSSDIASAVMQMDDFDLAEVGRDEIVAMSRDCITMLEEVGAAFRDRDSEKARRVAGTDVRIDEAQKALVERLFAHMQARPQLVPDASRMLWISHNMERCGDRATNIAEQVVFMVEAKAVELD
jgi:phosphate transport system protein